MNAEAFKCVLDAARKRESLMHLVAKSPQKVMYHGTSSKFLRTILKEGLKAKPSERVYDKTLDPSSSKFQQQMRRGIEAFEGTYLTTQYGTASHAALNAKQKFGGNRLYVVALIPDRHPQRVPDEDSLALERLYPIGDLSAEILAKYLTSMQALNAQLTKLWDLFWKNTLDRIALKAREEKWSKETAHYIMERAEKLLDLREDLFAEGFLPYLRVKFVAAMEDGAALHETTYKQLKYDGLVDKETGELITTHAAEHQKLRKFQDRFTKKWQPLYEIEGYGAYIENARMLEGIAYKGAARIVLVVEVLKAFDSQGPAQVKVHYSGPGASRAMAEFKASWKRYQGNHFEVVKGDEVEKIEKAANVVSRAVLEKELHGLVSKLDTASSLYLKAVKSKVETARFKKLAASVKKSLDVFDALPGSVREAIRESKASQEPEPDVVVEDTGKKLKAMAEQLVSSWK